VIPTPLWLMLFFVSVVQALLVGSVVTVIVAMLLLLLRFFDHPYNPGVGSLRPVAMERTLIILDQQLRVADQREPPPCDASGNSR
jgi:hypothetical protein